MRIFHSKVDLDKLRDGLGMSNLQVLQLRGVQFSLVTDLNSNLKPNCKW
uniref:Uncharacterized protein n=1 Tax=Rhizophora mucronata TaxID=61149 RepID=A0A2P2P1S7_RHIMU